jgi:hypothetical protein
MVRIRRTPLSLGAGFLLLLPMLLPTMSTSSAWAASVSIEVGPKFGEFSVVTDDSPISLRSAVDVERLVDGVWQTVFVANLYVIDTCGGPIGPHKPPPPCRSIAPSQRVVAVPWTGRLCGSQCPTGCHGEGIAPPGTYRFVIKTCDGSETFVSPQFEKP